MDAPISRILSGIANHRNRHPQPPISESTLVDLQSLLDHQTLINNNNNDVDDDDDDPDGQFNSLWHSLSFQSIPISSLIDPIASSMDSDPSIKVSLFASNVYLSLILSKNAPVLSIFSPMSFLSLLRSIRRSMKGKKVGPSSSSAERNGRRRGKGNRKRSLDYEEENGEFDVKLLFNVLDKLGGVLGLVHLDRFLDCLKSLVQTVAEIPLLGFELYGNSGNYKKLCDSCSRILVEVLRPEHGDAVNTASEVLKALVPLIMLVKSPPRAFAMGFVKNELIVMARNSDSIKKVVVNFPRYLSRKAPEKAEGRALIVESIMEVVKVMEFEDQVEFLEYVIKMAQSKSHLRYLAVDLILMLMTSMEGSMLSRVDDEAEESWGSRCLLALIQRCSDVVVGIRARALSNLAQIVGNFSSDKRGVAVLKKVLCFKDGLGSGMNELLRKRCMDEKAVVRRAALLLISKLMALLGGSLDVNILKTIGMACSDPLVSIRKAAISALSEAFRTFSDQGVITEWLHSVPRLITDSESSIQEECENLFMELVLDRVSKAAAVPFNNEPGFRASKLSEESLENELKMLFPGVLELLKEMCDSEVTPWVRKICASLGKKKKLKPKIVTALQNIIRISESLWLSTSMPIERWTAPPGAWFLLSEVSPFVPKAVDWEFLHHHWQLLDTNALSSELGSPCISSLMDEETEERECSSITWARDRVLLLQAVSNVSVELPSEPAADLAHKLLKRIEKFNMHSTEVNAHVKALKTLCKRKALNTKEADTLVTKWADKLFSKALRIIEIYLSKEQESNEASNLFTPPKSSGKKRKRSVASSKLLSQATTALYTIGSLVIVCPSIDLKAIVPILHGVITSGNRDPRLNRIPGSALSIQQKAPSLYIQAWLAMGKVCLADGKLAKRYIPLYMQELEKSDCAALRNNIIVIMADFCVQHTALVDCYIGKITKCLRDSCELVRRQTFILLSRLLQTDYVKWRGVLFLRFLLSLVDESEKIRQLADYLFGNILKAKAPLLAYNSFVEAVFTLNDCHTHLGHSKSQDSRLENRLFSIRGNDENARKKRMHIYVCLLKQMAPEHLLATFAKVCAEILAAASDGMLSFEDPSGQSVLQDAFEILTSKEIRIPLNRSSSSSSSDSLDADEDGGGSASKGRAITQAVKKGLIQNTIPIFIELKRHLESINSPLIGSLMHCLRLLLKDYKNEIDDILVADKQLQKELLYDIHKYESLKAKSTAEMRTDGPHTPEKSSIKTQQGVASKVKAAMADAAAAATARSVLREVNHGGATPPLSSMSMPKVKSLSAGVSQGDRSAKVLESLRRRQCFDSDEEN